MVIGRGMWAEVLMWMLVRGLHGHGRRWTLCSCFEASEADTGYAAHRVMIGCW